MPIEGAACVSSESALREVLPLPCTPRVSVLRGVDDQARHDLIGTLVALTRGRTPPISGIAEVHGVEVELERVGELIGAADGDPVVVSISAVMPALSAGAQEPVDDPNERAFAEAMITRETLEQSVHDLAAELAGAQRIRDGLLDNLAAANGRVIRESSTTLDGADGELRRAARQAGVGPWITLPDLDLRLAHLGEIVAECEEILAELPSGDRTQLASAVAWLRSGCRGG